MIDTPLIDTKEGRPKRTALLRACPRFDRRNFFNDTPQAGAGSPAASPGAASGLVLRPPLGVWPFLRQPGKRPPQRRSRAPTAARLRRAAAPLPPQELPAARPRRADRAPSRRGSTDSPSRAATVRCSEIIARSPCTLETVTVFFEPRPMLMTCAVRIPGGTGSPSAISRCARRASTV